MVTLTFEDTDDGIRNYEISFQAIALSDKQIPVSEWDDVVELIKKLKTVGRPAKEKLGKTQLYDLKDGGGEVVLERSEHKLLVEMIERPIWRPMVIEDAAATKEWLKAQKNDGGSQKPDAKPQAKRKAEGKVAGTIPGATSGE